MVERKCLKCHTSISEQEIKEENIEYWICPKCEKKNYKYSTKSWLGTGRFEGERIIKKDFRKETRDLRGNKSILQREKEGWTHEVVNDEGKVIHEKHKK